ncbi:MAG: hypothetical protein E4G89_02935 [Methanothrix sp.]|nr:MAG: hypothetical protein E4G89_02935 [Methanothrix sp.]
MKGEYRLITSIQPPGPHSWGQEWKLGDTPRPSAGLRPAPYWDLRFEDTLKGLLPLCTPRERAIP